MLQLEGGPPERVRVIGALTGGSLLILLEMVRTGRVLPDLSQVREADTAAVCALAELGLEVCDLLACPSWLALRVEIELRSQPAEPGVENHFCRARSTARAAAAATLRSPAD
jgi:hypothetical protein